MTERFAWIPSTVFEDERLNASDKVLLCALFLFADRKSGEAFPSLETLARMTSLGTSTIARRLKRLELLKIIKRKKRGSRDEGWKSTVYRILQGGLSHHGTRGYPTMGQGLSHHDTLTDHRTYQMEQKEALPKTDPPSKEKEPLQKPKSSRNKEIPQAHESREPKPKAKGAGGDEGDLYGRVVQRWNEIMPAHGGLPHHVPSRKYRENFFARVEGDKERESFDWWRCLMNFVLKSPFLTGQTEPTVARKRAFRASLEWLTDSEERLQKVLSGDYHDELPGRWARVGEKEEVEYHA